MMGSPQASSWEEYVGSSQRLFSDLFEGLRDAVERELPDKPDEDGAGAWMALPGGLLNPSSRDEDKQQWVLPSGELFAGAPGWQEDLAIRNLAAESEGLRESLEATIKADASLRLAQARRRMKAMCVERRNRIAYLGLQKSHFTR
jgi:hypothetical protein